MSIVRHIEVTAESSTSFDDACRQAVTDASVTVRNINQLWIKDVLCVVENDEITKFRVAGKLSFVVDQNDK